MNPTNDEAVPITPEELAEVLQSRKRRGLSATYPKTAPGFNMTPDGRLWWVTELVLLARAPGRPPEAREAMLDRARLIAAVVAQEAAADGNTDLLREVADALEGKRPEAPPVTKQQLVLSAVDAFCRTHGRSPSQVEVREFARWQGITLRPADVSEVMAGKFKKGKPPGRPPRK